MKICSGNKPYWAIFACLGITLGLLSLFLFVFVLFAPNTFAGDPAPTPQIRDASPQKHLSRLQKDSPNPSGPTQAFDLSLSTTVGLNESLCAAHSVLNVTAGTTVVYCYFVTNTGTEEIRYHSIDDDFIGPILSQVEFPLAAGTSALVTTTAIVTETTVNVGTWSGLDGNGAILATESAPAKVYVDGLTVLPGIVDANEECSHVEPFGAMAGDDVTFCYSLVNNTDLLLMKHTLIESRLGEIAGSLSYPLAPGERVTTQELGLTLSELVTTTSTYSLSWNASTTLLPPELSDEQSTVPLTLTTQATVVIRVPSLMAELTVGLEPGVCSDEKEITVFAGTEIVFCYFAQNSGGLTLTHHTVSDTFPVAGIPDEGASAFSTTESERLIVENTFYEMVPGGSGQFTNAQLAYTSTVVTMRWTAFSANIDTITDTNDAALLAFGLPSANTSTSTQPMGMLRIDSASLETTTMPSPVISATASSQVTITVLSLANIEITVYEDIDQNEERDNGEFGIPGATVLLSADNSEPFTATTDAEGVATFENLPLAVYDVAVRFEQPLQKFEPVGSGVGRILLSGQDNEGLELGYQRIGNPPENLYLPLLQ